MDAVTLSARGVSAGYGARTVVRGVDLEVRPGELWAILGPNGAGKSTLVRTCLGLHPASAGEVLLSGRRLTDLPRREVARRIAWVPQAVEPLVGFTGLELVLMGRSPHLGLWGVPSRKDVERADAVLAELGIPHLASRACSELSGGERRLLLLARALVQEPEVLLLDEPTAFLDLKHQVEALTRVRERVRGGLAALAVLHDVNLAAAFADRVLLLKEGVVQAAGPAAEVLGAGTLEALFDLPMARAEAEGGQPVFAPRLTR